MPKNKRWVKPKTPSICTNWLLTPDLCRRWWRLSHLRLKWPCMLNSTYEPNTHLSSYQWPKRSWLQCQWKLTHIIITSQQIWLFGLHWGYMEDSYYTNRLSKMVKTTQAKWQTLKVRQLTEHIVSNWDCLCSKSHWYSKGNHK